MKRNFFFVFLALSLVLPAAQPCLFAQDADTTKAGLAAMVNSGDAELQTSALDFIEQSLEKDGSGADSNSYVEALGLLVGFGGQKSPVKLELRIRAAELLGKINSDVARNMAIYLLSNEKDGILASAEVNSMARQAGLEDHYGKTAATILEAYRRFNASQPANNTLAQAVVLGLSAYQNNCGKLRSDLLETLETISVDPRYKTAVRTNARILQRDMLSPQEVKKAQGEQGGVFRPLDSLP